MEKFPEKKETKWMYVRTYEIQLLERDIYCKQILMEFDESDTSRLLFWKIARQLIPALKVRHLVTLVFVAVLGRRAVLPCFFFPCWSWQQGIFSLFTQTGHVNNKNWTASLIAMTSLDNKRKISLTTTTSMGKKKPDNTPRLFGRSYN